MGHYHLQEVISSNSMDPPNLHYILLAKNTAFTANHDAENTLQEYVVSAYFVDPYSVKIYFTKINSLSNYNYFIIFYYLHLSFIIFAIGSRGNWEVFAVGFIPSTNI